MAMLSVVILLMKTTLFIYKPTTSIITPFSVNLHNTDVEINVHSFSLYLVNSDEKNMLIGIYQNWIFIKGKRVHTLSIHVVW